MDLVGEAARESMRLQETATRVSINARMPGQTAVDPTALRKEFEEAAAGSPGIKAQDVAEATQRYVDLTGDLKTARENMKDFATVASATGASVGDVAEAAASMGKQLNVKDVGEMRKVMAMLTAEGKGGAMTMKDVAAQFQKLAAAGHAFGVGEGAEGVARLGGLVQIARAGTRSPQQAGTAVENIFSGLATKQKQLKQIGVDTYDKAGNRRDIFSILPEVIAKSFKGSDPKAAAEAQDKYLAQIFGKQGLRGVSTLVGTYRDASKAAGGGDAGRKAGEEAVAQALKNAANAATNWGEVLQDAAQQQGTTSAQLTAMWERFTAKIGDSVAPKLAEALQRLINSGAAADAIDKLAAAATFAADAALWWARMMGYEHKQTPEERLEKAHKAREKFEAQFANQDTVAHPLTRAQIAERQRLKQEEEDADEVLHPKADAGKASNLSKLGPRTSEEFVAAMMKGYDAAPEGSDARNIIGGREGAQRYYEGLAKEISASPNTSTSGMEITDEQKATVQQFQESQIADQAKRTSEAMAAVEKASQDAAKAIALLGQYGGPSGSGGTIYPAH